jgi:short subunit dehydrogenase-like uncharacterized protein
VQEGIRGARAVLHCAGPFAHTWRPVADACLRGGAHYLDVTGEVAVFEALAGRDAEARAAGVTLPPGAGFDVVPSDCLAAHLQRRLPTATRLALGFQGLGRLSRGTARTIAENLHRGGLVRRGGQLTAVPAAWKTRVIDFGGGPVAAMTIPWGDVATAYYSTGIPDIEVYTAAPLGWRLAARASRHLGWLLRSRPVQSLLRWRIRAGPAGPTEQERARGHTPTSSRPHPGRRTPGCRPRPPRPSVASCKILSRLGLTTRRRRRPGSPRRPCAAGAPGLAAS